VNARVYQNLTGRTRNPKLTTDELLTNYLLGIAGEVGELVNTAKKGLYHGHEYDADKVTDELGDCLWYLTELATLNGVSLSEVMERNIEKLLKRYPDGFSPQASRERVE
jgi:NTP pyrophosphatase (non-canonical NTP hydrolase)